MAWARRWPPQRAGPGAADVERKPRTWLYRRWTLRRAWISGPVSYVVPREVVRRVEAGTGRPQEGNAYSLLYRDGFIRSAPFISSPLVKLVGLGIGDLRSRM